LENNKHYDLNVTTVEMKNIVKMFGSFKANDGIQLKVHKGEIHAILGENGAGKSTLMNILYGIQTPTSGDVYIKGRRVEVYDPKNVIEQGVGMVHQHFMLVPSFTVAQNIVMSREPRKHKIFFDNAAAEAACRKLEEEYGLSVPETEPVEDISVGLQQRVEILKALYRGAEILILDEPTAVLTPQETEELFAVIRGVVREKGMTVIIITHKLDEVMAISDRVGVMRKGKLVGIHETKDVDAKKLASLMVGRPVLFDELERSGETGEAALRVERLNVTDHRGLPAVRDLSLELRA
jgi:simple sugar transport system ATP-binding protein